MSDRRRYELKAFDSDGNVCAQMVHECDAWTSDSLLCQILESVIIYAEKVQDGATAYEQWRAIEQLCRESKALADHHKYEMETAEIEKRVALAIIEARKGATL